MASRIALNSLRASARPRNVARAISARSMSSNPPPPAERASEIINSLPSSPGLITKTGAALLGTGLLATAISQEIYVVNEETVVAVGTFILFAYIYRAIQEPYKSWANGHIERTVKDRINSVEQMKDVVSLTEGLFTLSKETAKLENEAFVQRQKVALAGELKSVLDSWTVVAKVLAGLKDEKMQKDILTNAIIEVERLVKEKAI
ncbi:ATP4, subunit B of the stator stalk of mitochondrial F1F0 ATP synthase [Boletus edulis]|nr:ATP4, subunit B of the stator stalk of mitochondrial F1F0 ATP synthase [Boletus edulis]